MSTDRDRSYATLWRRLRQRWKDSTAVALRPAGATLIAVCILLAALVVRVAPFGRYVTPDEPAWVYRSILFADAIVARDWAAVPSTGHPGVTTMWLGSAGVAVRHLIAPAQSRPHLNWIRRMAWLGPENAEAIRHLAFYLPFGRAAVALTSVLGLAVVYHLCVRLFDRRIGLLVLGLLAFDAFLIGHSGLLHTDALLATFSAICVFALLAATRPGERGWLWALLGGAAGGLAVGTKTLAVILPAFAVTVLCSAWLARRISFSRALGLASLWALACAGVFIALYPAMWSAPLATLRDLLAAPLYQSTTALTPTFFAGEYALEHGPGFYAVALPYRLSPIVLVGLIMGVVAFWQRKSLRLEMAWLWLFVLGYVLMLAVSTKKFDRYLLPVLPPLTVIAALALAGAGGERSRSKETPAAGHRRGRTGAALLPLLALIVLQLAMLLPFVTNPLMYFSPLLGGPWAARHLLPTDWGEGMGAAARWLDEQPNASELTVAAASVPSFAPLFTGKTVPIERASLADFVVGSAGAMFSQQPAHTTHLGFLDRVAIYTNTMVQEQSSFLTAQVEPGQAIVSDANTPLVRTYSGPGTVHPAANLPDERSVAALISELSSSNGRLWLVSDGGASSVTAEQIRRTLAVVGTQIATARVGSATISQYLIADPPITGARPYAATFGDQLVLVDTVLPAEPVQRRFSVTARWRTPGPTPTELYASLYLRDTDGHVWSEVGQPVVNDHAFPTTEWAPGEWTDIVMAMQLPEHIAPGKYSVLLTLTDSQGMQLGAWDATGEFRGVRVVLGDVAVAPPAVTGQAAPCPVGRQLVGGPFTACVVVPASVDVMSGDKVTLPVIWSATGQPSTEYSFRFRLLDPSGEVAFEQIDGLSSYPTSQWRTYDTSEARYYPRADPVLPAAQYTLTLNILGDGGHQVWSQDEQLASIRVLGRDRLFSLPTDISHPLDLTLGTVVHLRGFDLATPAAVLQPGDQVDITLYWQADGPTESGYTVFAQLIGPDGQAHGQIDRLPAAGAAPTTSWAPGQVIIDALVISLSESAPEGEYLIVVGLYDADSGDRLCIFDEHGRSVPGDRVILPIGFTVGGGHS